MIAAPRMTRAERVAAAALAVFAASAVAVQVGLVIARLPVTGQPAMTALINTFSYFTILTNTLTAVAWAVAARRGGFDRWACSPRTLAAVAAFIAVVGLIYEMLLRERWGPIDLALLSDFALHDGVPTLTLMAWLTLVPKGLLAWRDPIRWLAYPLAYVLYTGIRGAITGWYPYPFISVARLGYPRTAVNTAGILLVFLLMGLVLVAVDRRLARRRS